MSSQQQQKIALKDLAFNKFGPKKNVAGQSRIELEKIKRDLTRNSYPINKIELNVKTLKESSNADAVVVQGDVQLPGGERSKPDYWGVKPIYPEEDKFWTEQLQECVVVRNARLEGMDPDSCYGWPIIMREARVNNMRTYTLEDIAAAVNGEYPASIQQTFIEWVFQDRKKKEMENDFILDLGQDFRSNRDFIGVQCRIAAINTWSFETVAPVNFMLKWSYGMPRPEEVAWLITNNKIKDDLTYDKVVHAIKNMNLKSQKDFTAYNKEEENGSPTHPSFPAMHSAASTISTWMPALFDLDVEQYKEALLTDYGTAMGRTVAGVHYPMDNIAGLNVGQRIIREELPAFVAEKYGYNADKVEARLDAFAFDWNNFKVKTTTIHGKKVQRVLINNKSVEEFFEKRKGKANLAIKKVGF